MFVSIKSVKLLVNFMSIIYELIISASYKDFSRLTNMRRAVCMSKRIFRIYKLLLGTKIRCRVKMIWLFLYLYLLNDFSF